MRFLASLLSLLTMCVALACEPGPSTDVSTVADATSATEENPIKGTWRSLSGQGNEGFMFSPHDSATGRWWLLNDVAMCIPDDELYGTYVVNGDRITLEIFSPKASPMSGTWELVAGTLKLRLNQTYTVEAAPSCDNAGTGEPTAP